MKIRKLSFNTTNVHVIKKNVIYLLLGLVLMFSTLSVCGQTIDQYMDVWGNVTGTTHYIPKFGKIKDEQVRIERSVISEIEERIGIGTTHPEEKLHVNGNIKTFPGFHVATSQIIAPDDNGLRLYNQNGTGIRIGENGNVGIGGDDMSYYRLSVFGKMWVTQESLFNIISSPQIKGHASFGLSLTDQDGNGIFVDNGGYVGIGTNAPSTILHIEDAQPSIQLRSLTHHDYNGIFMSHSVNGGQFEWFAGTPEGDAGKFMIASQITDTHQETTADIMNAGFVIERIEDPTDNIWNVGIGTSNFQEGYILTIDGKVMAEEVMIQNSDEWYDFVFDEGYDLPKLTELDNFIKENKHLPDVPTAKEVAENGYELGKMNGILLKKVEELTLYVIEQQKILEKQQKQIEILLGSRQ